MNKLDIKTLASHGIHPIPSPQLKLYARAWGTDIPALIRQNVADNIWTVIEEEVYLNADLRSYYAKTKNQTLKTCLD